MSSVKPPLVARSTVATSWRWMWPDIFIRIVPLTAIPFLYIAILDLPPSFLGLTLRDVPQQVALGLVVGLLMATLAAIYRMFVIGSGFRWPTINDHLFQGFYYLIINGLAEELFFRGFLLAAVTQWTGWIGWGCLASVATYTLYHRLGRWSWRSIGGVGLAGIVFSLVYLWQPDPRSLLAVAIVHGFTTSGFLSWGDEVLYRRWKYRQARTLSDN